MYNTMTKGDWERVDAPSREIVRQFLSTALSACGVCESEGNCCWDLSCGLKGKSVSVEIKDRSCPHDRYGDVMVERVKVDATSRKGFDVSLAVNVFADGYVAVARLDDPAAKARTLKCPLTSKVKGASRQYVEKECVTLPQRALVRFERDGSIYIFRKA